MDAAKSYEFERQPAYTRLVLRAELNAFHWDELQRSAQEILAELEKGGHRVVIVDLTPLDYLGSAQLTLLVRIWKLLKGRDARMIVELKSPVVREVLKTAGLLNVWEVADSHGGAFQILGLLSDGRQKTSPAVPVIGLLAVAGAIAGAGLSVWPIKSFDPRLVLVGALASAAVALGAGLWTVIRDSGGRRGLGVGTVVASALLAVTVVLIQSRPAGLPQHGTPHRDPKKHVISEDNEAGSAPAGEVEKAATESVEP